MTYKFEQLEVWQLALEYSDLMYALADKLPRSEDYNLKSQIIRAATSIALNIAEGSTSQSDSAWLVAGKSSGLLNIAEGSTSQSDAEQARFLGLAIRSLVETVACQHVISRREYLTDPGPLRESYRFSEKLFAKLQAFRATLRVGTLREEPAPYDTGSDTPF